MLIALNMMKMEEHKESESMNKMKQANERMINNTGRTKAQPKRKKGKNRTKKKKIVERKSGAYKRKSTQELGTV